VDAVQILELNKHPTTDSSSTPNYKFLKKSNCLIDSTEQQKPAQGKVKVGSFDAIQEQSECPRKWIESEFLRRNLSRGTHRTLSKELKFLKENAQIPPRKNPDRQEKKKLKGGFFLLTYKVQKLSCISARAGEGRGEKERGIQWREEGGEAAGGEKKRRRKRGRRQRR
jgi:hypothetical protein